MFKQKQLKFKNKLIMRTVFTNDTRDYSKK